MIYIIVNRLPLQDKQQTILWIAILFAFGIEFACADTNPPAMEGHSAVYIEEKKEMIIFGGIGDDRVFSDTWLFNIDKRTWEQIEADESPLSRYGHSAIYDSVNKQMIIYGGMNPTKGALSDVWAFDINKNSWKEIKAIELALPIGAKKEPLLKYNHSAVYNENNKQMVVFGGAYGVDKKKANFVLGCNEIWVFDIGSKEWKEIEVEGTPSLNFHRAIYDPVNKQMIVWGGNSKGFFRSDTWIFDLEGKNWKEIIEGEEEPSARGQHSAVYDSKNKHMLVFGGWDKPGSFFSDLWTFNIENKTWDKIELEEEPSPRYSHSAVYDSVNKQMIIFGGRALGKLSDTWIFDIEKKKWEKVEIE